MRGARHALLTISSLCAAALPALAAHPYAEYRIPDHRWLSWSAGLTANGHRTQHDGSYGSESVDRQGYGTAATSLYGGFDSDRRSRAYGLSLLANGAIHTFDGQEAVSYETYLMHRRDESALERASAFYALSRFPWQAPLGFSLSTNAFIAPRQQWGSYDEVRRQAPSPFYSGYKVESL